MCTWKGAHPQACNTHVVTCTANASSLPAAAGIEHEYGTDERPTRDIRFPLLVTRSSRSATKLLIRARKCIYPMEISSAETEIAYPPTDETSITYVLLSTQGSVHRAYPST